MEPPSSRPAFPQPSLDYPYVVIWVDGGRVLSRAFRTVSAAHHVYETIIAQQNALRRSLRKPFAVYIAVVLLGDEEHSNAEGDHDADE